MREMSVRDANQNFSRVIAAAERGETIVVTKNGRPVARITPQSAGRGDDPEWRRRHDALSAALRNKPATGFRVGRITEDDKYGADEA